MKQKGFTLVELLVVIGIISLLAAIMMPVLSLARSKVRSLKCMSNLRQLGIAAQIYTAQNDDFYPIAYNFRFTQNKSIIENWDFTTIRDFSTRETKIVAGLLFSESGAGLFNLRRCYFCLRRNDYVSKNSGIYYLDRAQRKGWTLHGFQFFSNMYRCTAERAIHSSFRKV